MTPAREPGPPGTLGAPPGGSGAGYVLVVEDEPGIADFLDRGLEAEGFRVLLEADGVAGEASALRENVDVVVLDLMLPGRSGLEVLASLRAGKPEVPVIVLTAKGEVEDRVAGLDAGAVDYLVKPFSLAELTARIRAQLRTASQGATTRLEGEGIDVDLLSRRVRRGGAAIALSRTEFELLAHLMRNRARVVSREEIHNAVWGYEHDPSTNIVDVYIGYLRRKLRDGETEAPIQTIRSVGYRFGRAGG
jgi:DNA-binding response OmpR family regulator